MLNNALWRDRDLPTPSLDTSTPHPTQGDDGEGEEGGGGEVRGVVYWYNGVLYTRSQWRRCHLKCPVRGDRCTRPSQGATWTVLYSQGATWTVLYSQGATWTVLCSQGATWNVLYGASGAQEPVKVPPEMSCMGRQVHKSQSRCHLKCPVWGIRCTRASQGATWNVLYGVSGAQPVKVPPEMSCTGRQVHKTLNLHKHTSWTLCGHLWPWTQCYPSITHHLHGTNPSLHYQVNSNILTNTKMSTALSFNSIPCPQH